MVLLAHISDLHVGSINFDEDILLEAIEEVNGLNLEAIIITGDLTQNGYYHEYLQTAEYLKLIKTPIMVVPGNHDARHVGNESFEEIFLHRQGTLSSMDRKIKIIGLDSSEPDLDYGKVGRAQQQWMESELIKAYKMNQYKIIALHHHIIPVPKTGRERNVLTDAGDVLQSIIHEKADLVVSGHKHVPHVWHLENTTFVTAGSVSSLKLRGKDVNSYNVYEILDEKIRIKLNTVGGTSNLIATYDNKCAVPEL